MRISVRVDKTGVSRMLQRLHRDQLPFALSVALNETAKKVQAEQRTSMKRRFKIRREWTLQGIKITKFAKKQGLIAVIGIDEGREFLAKFEEGDDKVPRGTRIAIPDQARRTKADIVPTGSRPRAFNFRLIGSGPKADVYRGNKRTFMIMTRDGEGVVIQRTGGGFKGRDKRDRQRDRAGRFDDQAQGARSSNTKILFTFARRARTERLLHFHDTARRVVPRVFPGEFEKAFRKAIETARRG